VSLPAVLLSHYYIRVWDSTYLNRIERPRLVNAKQAIRNSSLNSGSIYRPRRDLEAIDGSSIPKVESQKSFEERDEVKWEVGKGQIDVSVRRRSDPEFVQEADMMEKTVNSPIKLKNLLNLRPVSGQPN